MSAQSVSSSINLIDSAVGPLGVTKTVFQNFDIDDFVHNQVIGQALQLRLIFAAATANSTLAQNRPPINIEGTTLGGS